MSAVESGIDKGVKSREGESPDLGDQNASGAGEPVALHQAASCQPLNDLPSLPCEVWPAHVSRSEPWPAVMQKGLRPKHDATAWEPRGRTSDRADTTIQTQHQPEDIMAHYLESDTPGGSGIGAAR